MDSLQIQVAFRNWGNDSITSPLPKVYAFAQCHDDQHFQSKENLIWFLGKCFSFWLCLFSESGFRETTFQTFMCLFAIRKVGLRKTLSSQKKIWLGFQESVFLENLDGKHFPEVVKNLKMPLFTDYIKFDPQTFDCYIYFVLNIYF